MSRRIGPWLVLTAAITIAIALAAGCPTETPVVEPVVTLTYDVADAGDEAFVKRASLLVWGRRPASLFELRALLQIVEQSDRETLVRAMARSGEFIERWEQWTWDALGVNRAGLPFNLDPVTLARCFSDSEMGADDGALARFVKENGPGDTPYTDRFTMKDLVRSCLVEDDLSSAYRANLFPFLGWEMVPSGFVEAALQRQSRYEIFERTYLHRSSVCLTCHNSEFSSTGHVDPELDRTWEVPAYVETALFDSPTGPDDLAELHLLFRRWGVIYGPAFLGEQMSEPNPDQVVLVNGCMSAGPAQIGCDGCACEETVCGLDPTCCTGQWDMVCAELCMDTGLPCSPPLPVGFQGCSDVMGGTGGCDGCACEQEVCADNQLCCEQAWGAHCAFACSLADDTDCSPVSEDAALRPWGMVDRCGLLTPLDELQPDTPSGLSTFFGSDLGDMGSVHDVEALLRSGVLALEGGGLEVGADFQVAPDAAFAWMTGANIAAQVWKEAVGTRLTVANYFPRNIYQRDVLIELTNAFVQNGWSLVDLLVAVTGHPLFNTAPSALIEQGPYVLPPVLDPFTKDAGDPAVQGNGPGELVHRHPARVLVRAAYTALGWSEPETFVHTELGANDVVLSTGVGAFRTDKNQGFGTVDFQSLLVWEEALGHCDFRQMTGNEPEWFDGLMTAISDHDGVVLWEDAVSALKERLLNDPDLSDATERELVEALLGQSLDSEVSGNEQTVERLRVLCGALVSSPQFLLAGNMGPDRASAQPALVHVAGDDFASHCAAIATLFPDGAVTCAENSLSLSD